MINKLIVAYIGFGTSVKQYHLPYVNLRKDKIQVKYIYRREEDVIREGKEEENYYPNIIFTNNIDDIMNDMEVNLVVINTPNDSHVLYSMMALEHGKNVLCEKPFALSVQQAKEVFDFAKKKGLVITANQNRRFDADILTVKKVIESNQLGELLEIESHYDYYRPTFYTRGPKIGILYGLTVHTIDQIIGLFGIPDRVNYDVRSFDYPGQSDDYCDIDLFYGNMKVIIKNNYYVKLDYPKYIVHGRKGSFIVPALGHNSSKKKVEGPYSVDIKQPEESKWGTISYIDENGNDITQKIPSEIGDYGKVYDNLYDVIFNNGEKIIKDEEILTVLKIIEEGIEHAKNFSCKKIFKID